MNKKLKESYEAPTTVLLELRIERGILAVSDTNQSYDSVTMSGFFVEDDD